MAEYHEEKLRIMEDEMNRFEAEIAVPVPPHMARAVIGANTYNQVQRRLEEQQLPDFHPGMFCPPVLNMIPGFVGIPPPPPPPPPLLIPHQLQQRPVRNMMAPPSYDMNPPQRQQFQPSNTQPPTLPSSSAVLSVAPLLYNPNRPAVPKMKPSKLIKPVQSTFDMDTYATFQNELSQLTQPPPKKTKQVDNKYESLHAKDMAAKVKASAMNAAVAPTVGTSSTADEPPPTNRKKNKKNKLIRMAGGQTWEDGSLAEWEDDDYRIFCGDLGNDVTDEILTRTFNKYTSFLKAKVVRDKRSNKTKGFGFVSFKDPQDFIKAMKEMNGRYVGSRPIKLRKSSWKSRNLDNVRKKEKEKNALIGMLTGR